MNVLIVEQTKLYQQLIGKLFAASGVGTRIVSDGKSALNAIQGHAFDLVCTARLLPDMSGLELIRQLRVSDSHSQVAAILITADESEKSLREGFDAGFTEVLSKANLDAIRQTIERLIERFNTFLHGKVLYLEDSPSVAAVTKALLQEMGLTVDHFTNAEDGLAAFEDIDYDLVVSDVMLEGTISGVGVVNRIRKLPGDKSRTPILAVSASNDEGRRIELLRFGVNDYVTKPIQQDEFSARVSNLIHYKQLFDQVRQQQEKMEEMATTDMLTGLFNRHSLSEFGPKYVSDAYRHNTALSLLVVDLDHFKSINDNHGHATGDEVLAGIGLLLKGLCRNEDMAARFGGEEFVVVLSHCAREDAEMKAEAIRAQVESLRPAGLMVTPSIGVATLPGKPHINFESLFKAADEAVYAAKHGGRNQVRVFDGEFESEALARAAP